MTDGRSLTAGQEGEAIRNACGGPPSFVAGVRLFAEACSVVERAVNDDDASVGLCLYAALRDGVPLRLDLLPVMCELMRRPELIGGFSAALQDYMLTVAEGGEPSTRPYREASFATAFGGPASVS